MVSAPNLNVGIGIPLRRPAIDGGEPVREKGRFLVFGQPDIGQAEIDAVTEVLRGRWIGTGPHCHAFEAEFAAYLGLEAGVAVNSATAALHLSLLALDVGPGDEVVTTAMTFCATVNVICHVGATPVLCDCDPATQCILPAEIEMRITPRTKAIIVVHMCGRPCEMDAIMAIADRHGIPIIEDCAHAIETRIGERPVGTYGTYACYSFYATKNLTTAEGGMVVARDPARLTRIRTLSLHGQSSDAWERYSNAGFKRYDVVEPGWKYNLTDIAAAMGRAQLPEIENRLERRRAIVEQYDAAFADLPLILPPPAAPDTRLAYHLYTVQVDEKRTGISRNDLLVALRAENIGVGVHYEAVHTLAFYRSLLGLEPEDLPNAAWIGASTLSLPLSTAMTDEDVADAILGGADGPELARLIRGAAGRLLVRDLFRSEVRSGRARPLCWCPRGALRGRRRRRTRPSARRRPDRSRPAGSAPRISDGGAPAARR